MVEVRYTNHLKLRLKIRKIPFEYPKLILGSPDRKFIDIIENKGIAVKRLKYNKKVRNMMIAFEEKGNIIDIVTIHPIPEEKIINRVMSGRWK